MPIFFRPGTTVRFLRAGLIAAMAVGLASCASDEEPAFRFRRVAAGVLPQVGVSFGATWADVDGDGKRDLVLGRHGQGDGLYLDRAGLGFVRADSCTPLPCDRFDQHGIAAADFDRDGDWGPVRSRCSALPSSARNG